MHHVVYRRAGGPDELKNLALRHTACHRREQCPTGLPQHSEAHRN
ncbi:HNH endonuclease [Streptomyces sp. NPDC102476]